jgi:hypothetical protein
MWTRRAFVVTAASSMIMKSLRSYGQLPEPPWFLRSDIAFFLGMAYLITERFSAKCEQLRHCATTKFERKPKADRRDDSQGPAHRCKESLRRPSRLKVGIGKIRPDGTDTKGGALESCFDASLLGSLPSALDPKLETLKIETHCSERRFGWQVPGFSGFQVWGPDQFRAAFPLQHVPPFS